MKTQTHSSNLGKYIGVFLGLGVLTAVEVVVAFVARLDANILIPILLVLAVVKAALVAMFFMHLKDDTKWFSLIFIYPILLASLLIFWVVFPS